MPARKTLFLVLIFLLMDGPATLAAPAEWQAEFDELCSAVETAETLSIEELKSLIERVDKLLPIVESSEAPGKKVIVFRLHKCRKFFEFIIELKASKG